MSTQQMHITGKQVLPLTEQHCLPATFVTKLLPMQCFSMHVLMNKCFLLKSKKKLVQIRLIVFE